MVYLTSESKVSQLVSNRQSQAIKMILEKNGILSLEDVSKHDKDLLRMCFDIEHRIWIGKEFVAGNSHHTKVMALY